MKFVAVVPLLLALNVPEVSSDATQPLGTPAAPPPWPLQLRVRAVTSSPTGTLSVDTINYDWPGQRNIIHIQYQGNTSDLYDLELGNGQEYYYTPAEQACNPMKFPVGILRPDWLANATYLTSTTVSNSRPTHQRRGRCLTSLNEWHVDM